MAEMTIRLQIDPTTGKRDVIVSLRSDDDSLPHEHEHLHRALVEKLVQGGVLQASEVGKIVVEREETADEPAAPVSVAPAAEGMAQTESGS